MIWFFLAGMVAGATGMVMYARWYMSRHTVTITKEEMLNELFRSQRDQETDEPDCREERPVPEPPEHGDGED